MNFLFNRSFVKMNYLVQLLLVFVLIYLFILTSTYIFQRKLLYQPGENNYSGDQLLVDIEEIKILTEDNIELLSWFHKKDLKKYKTILFFHGNAGNLENRIHKINHFKDMKINFIIVSWRGFSGNKGQPTEKGLYKDGKSAVKWLKMKGVEEEDIVIYGESLGTGIAIEIAQNKNFAGIILESPFTSMVDAGKTQYPYLPVRFLLKDKYESDKKIKKVKSPILIMHGKIDQIVPFYMGKKMYEIANEPKFSYFSKYDDHMMEFNENMLKTLRTFLDGLN
tara:strand:+ start:1521 stop:2357 length:837 start_codon:yes stop_codon:yes gene_type:complete